MLKFPWKMIISIDRDLFTDSPEYLDTLRGLLENLLQDVPSLLLIHDDAYATRDFLASFLQSDEYIPVKMGTMPHILSVHLSRLQQNRFSPNYYESYNSKYQYNYPDMYDPRYEDCTNATIPSGDSDDIEKSHSYFESSGIRNNTNSLFSAQSPWSPNLHYQYMSQQKRRNLVHIGRNMISGSVTIFLYFEEQIITDFLSTISIDWIRGRLLIINLRPASHSGYTQLELASSVYKSALLHYHVCGTTGEGRFFFTTHYPFSKTEKEQFRTWEWVPSSSVSLRKIFPERFRNFHGHEFHVTCNMKDFPALFYVDKARTKRDGFSLPMIDTLAENLNFRYTLDDVSKDDPDDDEYSDIMWTKMVEQLERGDKDLIINTLQGVEEHIDSVDLLHPFATISYCAVLKRPISKYRLEGVLMPFTWDVWVTLSFVIIFMTIMFHFVLRDALEEDRTYDYDVFFSMLWITQMLFRQSVSRVPTLISCRLFLSLWWIMTVVLGLSYTSNLIAFLTLDPVGNRISSLQELVSSDRPLYLHKNRQFLGQFLLTSDSPLYRKLGKRVTHPLNTSIIEIEVHTKDAAYIERKNSLEFHLSKWVRRDLYLVEGELLEIQASWALPKHTPWKHIFNRYLMRMIHSGLLNKWKKDTVTNFQKGKEIIKVLGTKRSRKVKLTPLSFENLQGSTIVFFIGHITALTALIMEFLYKVAMSRFRKKKEIENKQTWEVGGRSDQSGKETNEEAKIKIVVEEDKESDKVDKAWE
ncbi:hypothetical protein SK128_023080 [Halocaridina rubra]|uniref:Ionotropic glutamate receptor C-terminal domain-containing protein n=1 Tax=Halocaridina rubra TaxID=373956 RepID=A0AAN8X1F6_HALRR